MPTSLSVEGRYASENSRMSPAHRTTRETITVLGVLAVVLLLLFGIIYLEIR